MLALYRSGRQADALEAYQRARALPRRRSWGSSPAPALLALQAEILGQSPSLDAPVSGVTITGLPARRGRRCSAATTTWRAVIDLLERDGAQLVTLTGVGGVGKTQPGDRDRATAWPSRLAGGAAFVDLAPLTDAADVPGAALRALGGTVEPDESRDGGALPAARRAAAAASCSTTSST